MPITAPLADTARASRLPLLSSMARDVRERGTLTKPTATRMWLAYGAHAAVTAWVLTRPDRLLPLPSALARPVGLVVAAGGLALCGGGMSRFSGLGELEGTRSQEFTTAGLYGWSRNPQYAGYVLALGGAAIASRSLAGLGLTTLAGLAYDSWIPVEEQQLADRHGPIYLQYVAATPRWLGRPARP